MRIRVIGCAVIKKTTHLKTKSDNKSRTLVFVVGVELLEH